MAQVTASGGDPERFNAPEEFACPRDNARQAITFGHGIHFCPGQPLARLEGRLAVTEWLRRMTNIRFAQEAPEFDWPFWFLLRGPGRLDVRFDRR